MLCALCALPPAPLLAAGPDVIIALIFDIRRWDRIGDITAYSIGTTSCNVGDTVLLWQATTNQHPVIAQGMFRLLDGRFEQIGQSWLKHGFEAQIQSQCGLCQDPQNGQLLGVGCSDPYSANLNGSQSRLGPRWEVNPASGYFPYPFSNPPINSALDRRIQVRDADLDPDLNPGALYFVEGHYVTPDDAAAGNALNNAAYRRITITEQDPPGSNIFLPAVVDTTQPQKPAIQAWQDVDPSVVIVNADVPGDGRLIVAATATNLMNGFWRYRYAVENFNSDRAAGAFRVALHPYTAFHGTGFHDVPYHSGEPFDGTDWPVAFVPANDDLTWSVVQTFGQNPNANALRWGTLYNFSFDANIPPVANAEVTLELFKPGTPAEVVISILGPSPAFPDCNGNTTADYLEIQANPALDCDGNGNLDACDTDCNGNLIPDACDIAAQPGRDCNLNGMLDVCEIAVGSPAPGGPFFCTANCAPDCNDNGKPDSCDIASGFDPDCNGNQVPDTCDISGGLEVDCDADNVPDRCEIAANPALDCNLNGQLDACGEIDCNGNLVPDDCEGPSCAAVLAGDIDCNAAVELPDIPGFVAYLLVGNPSCRADMNHDGRVDSLDVQVFKNTILP
jgi:hypothetical protein